MSSSSVSIIELEMQLRAAEGRRADLQRAHADAMRAAHAAVADALLDAARQSHVRELEKKVALETVRCEELQLELATAHRGRASPAAAAAAAAALSPHHHHLATSSCGEIDRIMAKIEQDNRILAELEHTRATTLAGVASSASSHALGETGTSPPAMSPIAMSHTTLSLFTGGGGGGGALPTFSSSMLGTGTSTSIGLRPQPLSTASSSPYAPTFTFANHAGGARPLSALPMAIKLQPLDDLVERRVGTPLTPLQALGVSAWTPPAPGGALAADAFLNGHPAGLAGGEGVVDMLDIPGRGRCCVYVARFACEPDEAGGGEADEELAVQAGDYLLVWGGEPLAAGGYLDGELLDGRRGLVPAHCAQRLIGDDLLDFHQAVLTTLREDERSEAAAAHHLAELAEAAAAAAAAAFDDHHDDDDEADVAGEPVAAPRQLTLERQLHKSVLISWTAPEGAPHLDSYHVYVDGVLKATVKASERTRALVEGVDSGRAHRISVRSATTQRRTSRDAACTMVIGREAAHLGPSAVRATRITAAQAVISWLPANSNHQHVVCVNNVEVRCVRPGVHRHTITGLAANTQYRVTVRAKHARAAPSGGEEAPPPPPAAHADFRTLPKGLPDPPADIQLEAGPQDGTLLVTWQPVAAPAGGVRAAHASPITGYAVFADGKKVTEVESPTGDHALIDIGKLLGMNPKHVTVRTKARDGQSPDSLPAPIPLQVLRGGGGGGGGRRQPHTAMPLHMRPAAHRQQPPQQQQQQQQQIIEHDENLSDKEVFPAVGGAHRVQPAQPQPPLIPQIVVPGGGAMRNPTQVARGGLQQQQQQKAKRTRWFVALFDYDPATMSPNPYACDEELPFAEGDSIRVWGDKDADGFYWGECRGRRGYVPHNMVMEVEGGGGGRDATPMRRMVALYDYDPQELSPNVDAEVELSFATGQLISVYGEMDDDGFYMAEIDGVRGLVPSNFLADATSTTTTATGGDAAAGVAVAQASRGRGRGHGPGARGPPPPPRDSAARPHACPVLPSQSDTTNTAPPNTQAFSEHQRRGPRGGSSLLSGAPSSGGGLLHGLFGASGQPAAAAPTTGGFFSNPVSNLLGGGAQQQPHHHHQQQQQQQQQQQYNQANSYATATPATTARMGMKGVPAVVPTSMQQQQQLGGGAQAQTQPQQPPPAGALNVMQKLNEMAAPGGDILSKGKELIFMKFGLGGK